jgi:hypothetical protein
LARRLNGVEVLERHDEVAGFIYAVIGVAYAVLLGFAAITGTIGQGASVLGLSDFP